MSATDTWFHLETKTIKFTQAKEASNSLHRYGRDISSTCLNTHQTSLDIGLNFAYPNGTIYDIELPCSVDPIDNHVQIANASEALSTANNASSINSAIMVVLGNESYAILADANASTDLDFTASTFAANTQCTSITSQCFKLLSSEETKFNCSLGRFSGTFVTENKRKRQSSDAVSWEIGYVDPESNTTTTDSLEFSQFASISNYTWILVTGVLVTPDSAGTTYDFACNTSIWNVTYAVRNGLYSLHNQTTSNRITAFSLTGPITTTYDAQIGNPVTYLQNRFSEIALTGASMQEIESQFADAYSTLTMALSAGIMTPILNINESIRTDMQVTQVSKAPLFMIVTIIAVYIIGGIILASIALSASRHDVNNLQSLLSLTGITAAAFERRSSHTDGFVESTKDLYQEMVTKGKSTTRIYVEESLEGNWQFRVLDDALLKKDSK